MGAKATFNPITRIIKLTEAPSGPENSVFIDVQIDLYGAMKEDWLNIPSLRKYHPPIRVVGGDPLPGSKTLGDTYFLRSDWKIEPYDGDQRLTIEGNFYSEDGTSPFIKPTGGTYSIQIERSVSNLVDSTIAQLDEIEYASFQNGVSVDAVIGVSGTDYPRGTTQLPVNNMTDAVAIAITRGFNKFYILSDISIGPNNDYSGCMFEGEDRHKTSINIEPDAIADGWVLKNLVVTGQLDGYSYIEHCTLRDVGNVAGEIHNSKIEGKLTIGGSLEIFNSHSGTKGIFDPATIDMDGGGGGKNVAIHGWSGHIKITNMPSFAVVGIGCIGGAYVEIDNTVSDGMIHLMGNFKVVDNSTGTAVIKTDYVTSPVNIAMKVDASEVLAKEATLNLVKAVTDRLPAGIARNKGKNNFAFLMVLSSDHITPALGKTVSAQKSVDGGAFISCDNGVFEVSNGIYKIDLSPSDTDGDVITYVFTASGCDPRYITVITG